MGGLTNVTTTGCKKGINSCTNLSNLKMLYGTSANIANHASAEKYAIHLPPRRRGGYIGYIVEAQSTTSNEETSISKQAQQTCGTTKSI